MNFQAQKMNQLAPTILRVGVSLVFIWFGFKQITLPQGFMGYIPQWLDFLPIEFISIVYANGVLEISFGLMLLFGLFTRFCSFVLGIHLLFIALSIGFNATGIRDLGLTMATFAVFFYGADEWTLDSKLPNFFQSKVITENEIQ